MTESNASPVKTPRRGGLWRAFLLLIVLAALAAGGWQLWQRLESATRALDAEDALVQHLSQQLRGLEVSTDAIRRRQEDAEAAARRNTAAVAELRAGHDATSKTLDGLDATLRSGRLRFQLAVVEELLTLAHDHVALDRDMTTARTALELADARLASLQDPRLLPIREALAGERLGLQSAQQSDVSGAALMLGSLLTRSKDFPLRSRVPQPASVDSPAPEAASEPTPSTAEWPTRLWAGTKAALAAVFQLHRETHPVDRLLPPEQEALIQTILSLKLEGARLALLRGDAASFRDLLDGARQWLGDHYVAADPRVQAAQAELERLRALDLLPTLTPPHLALDKLRALVN